ncbi:hypothetical protein VTJ83DRAFT_713 [Remersonia thermophila]|uniref:xylan 1,4-beta-xylosidase n=1 Tax=Remersonia thermophila TaxID=72144 RepID=A0ABR4DLW1_9PEZI
MKLLLGWKLAIAVAVRGAVGLEYPDCINGPLANSTVCDVTASPADRAAALVKLMSVAEKLDNLVDMAKGVPRLGLPPYAWWSEALHGVALSPGVTFNFTGIHFSNATSFANTITLAAAFDDDLVYQVASAISTEARAFANAGLAGLDYWSPNVNPYKDPRWGRGHEVRDPALFTTTIITGQGVTENLDQTPGEDPVRIKGYAKAFLTGLEGDGPARKVIATCKHYAAYDLERWQGVTRHDFNAVVSLQDLVEYYLPPFETCARDVNVGSIMCSYNAVNGTPACANTYLMDDILRKHWNWTAHNNYVTSDCNAIQNFLPSLHNFSQTPAEAAAAALNAGTDTICEVPGWPPYTDVAGAYRQGLVSEAVIDRALHRLYEGLVRVGYFDPPTSASPAASYRSLGASDVSTLEHQALAFQSAADGLVLLKNVNGTLPLRDVIPFPPVTLTGRPVAIIGHWAAPNAHVLGGYSGVPPYLLSPLHGAELLQLNYTYAAGPPVAAAAAAAAPDAPDGWTAPALAAAGAADVILYFGGTDLSVASEDRDRDSLAWPPAQLSLVEALASLGKPLVVAQLGDQLDDAPLLANPNVSAVLWAGYPGQAGGLVALYAILGLAAPAGRLPVTQYAADYARRVDMTDMRLRPDPAPRPADGRGAAPRRDRPAGESSAAAAAAPFPGRTYRWLPPSSPLSTLPFGFGLHYTRFRARLGVFPTLSFTTASLLAGCANSTAYPYPDLCPFPVTVSVWVSNLAAPQDPGGGVTSDYVALVFAAGEYGPRPYPVKTLVGYKRLRAIGPGQTQAAVVDIKLGDLARVDTNGNRILYPGRYKFVLDVGQDGNGVDEVEFDVTGDEVVLDVWPQPRAQP